MSLFNAIKMVSANVNAASKPASLAYGTVTKASPLEIQINENLLTISGSTILLTEPVIEKKITIEKHTHSIGDTLAAHTHPVDSITYVNAAGATTPCAGIVDKSAALDKESTIVVDTVLNAKCTEFGVDLPVDKNGDRIIFTINRGLEVGDKVIMLRLMEGQKFVVLSRIFGDGTEGD